MEGWKNIGIFLTGFAAVITAVSGFINYINEPPKNNSLGLEQNKTIPIERLINFK